MTRQKHGDGEATARAIPGARLVVYDGIGYGPPREVPDQFNRDVIQFLIS
jgi:pimeloyl-ACP methyl ester carboxylesterase